MKVQTLTLPVKILNLVIGFSPTDSTLIQSIQACSRDYGFDFEEEEIGRELRAPLPANILDQSIPELEELETLCL